MILKLQNTIQTYPRQFWLMFAGMLISTIGSSMIWPFLMIYATERLNVPMTTAAALMTINAAAGMLASFIAGPIIDRFGRKWMMVGSLATNGLTYLILSQASTLPEFAIAMALSGAVNPLYRVGADAMLADLVPADKRIDAYALVRLSNNLGIAIGPAIGGFIATASYNLAFYLAATGMVVYSLLLTLFAVETLPKVIRTAQSSEISKPDRGYGPVLRDKPFLSFVAAVSMAMMCATLIWLLMPVYAKQAYQIPENLYGLIPTTNALMVVTLQLVVTRISKRYPPLPSVAVGALLYAIGVGSVAWASNFWGFWTSMVIMTFGELILVPTSSTYTANRAPADMRGRYMSIYGLTWGIASGIGPLVGGFLNDSIGPSAIWYGGAFIGAISVFALMILASWTARQVQIQPVR